MAFTETEGTGFAGGAPDKQRPTGEKPESPEQRPAGSGFSDKELLDLFNECKRESFDQRWVWERQWMRAIHFVNFRQWITYVARHNEWRDIRMAKHIPRPVSSKPKETVQALRAMFASINIGVNVRPNGSDSRNIAVAAIADEFGPVLHERHAMNHNLNEADYWLIVTGNVFIHTYLNRDIKNGVDVIPFEQCVSCKAIYDSPSIAEAGQKCPDCGQNQFIPAVSEETGEPMEITQPKGRGKTDVLSPFELAFPNTYSRFADLPYVIRLRWRPKEYYLGNPTLKPLFSKVSWQKAPSELSMQLFRSLPHYNDTGVAPFVQTNSGGGGGSDTMEEGLPEYELWYKPCDAYPEGLVARFAGDKDPIVIHLEDEEAVPGPFPYKDADGKPLFTFSHACFEQVGGRIYGAGPIDAIIPKVQQLNRLDSHFEMIINRMSNPLWLVPKGSEIEKLTGEAGLVVKWNPLTVGGQAEPKRVPGEGPHGSFFQIREMYSTDIEEAAGTFDIVKGAKPTGVEAFAAMQLLVERSQSRFASAFQSRGELYKDWFKFALEIEREFGPDSDTIPILTPARTWAFKSFKKAQLQGSVSVVVEDGSNTPKSSLGIRAAIEHLNSLGLIDKTDPDQRYRIYQLFGQPQLSPTLDIHMQAALQKQQAFEEWAINPMEQQKSLLLAQQEQMKYEQALATAMPAPVQQPPAGPGGAPAPMDPNMAGQQMAASLPKPPSPNKFTPLAWKPWYKPEIHLQEFDKWANGDSVTALLKSNPKLEPLLVAHRAEIVMALQEAQMLAAGPMPGAPGGAPGGVAGARGMRNSNDNAGATGAAAPRGPV